MVQGIQSKRFGCYWSSMFITAMCYPEKFNPDCKEHVLKMKHYKSFYDSFQYILSCKFCRDYTKKVLMKEYPLQYTGRIALMKSLYVWKDIINKKLISQGCTKTKPSPPFEDILKRYEKIRAKCNKSIGKCV